MQLAASSGTPIRDKLVPVRPDISLDVVTEAAGQLTDSA